MTTVSFTRSLLAATALAGLTAAAQAQTNYAIPSPPPAGSSVIYGGGSSLATPTYTSLFGFYTPTDSTVAFNYTSKGSGNSQCAFIVDTAVPAGTITGAQSFLTAASPSQHVDLAASDAALTAIQVDIYTNGYTAAADGATSTCSFTNQTITGAAIPVPYPAGTANAPKLLGGPIIQLPSFGTPITIPFNVSGVRNNPTSVKLTDDQLCGIFSGKISYFGDPALAGSGLQNASTAGQLIRPVVRSDGSGTTFLLLQHLIGNTAAYPVGVPGVCTAANSNFNIAGVIGAAAPYATAGTTFVNALIGKAFPIPSATAPGAPVGGPAPTTTNFLTGNGSSGVLTTLQGNSNTLAYLSPDFTKAAPINNGSSVPFVAQVRNGTNGTFYAPTAATTQLALGTGTPPAPASATDPGTLAVPQAYVPTVNNPPVGYPIVGYTTFEFAQCYADNQLATGIYTFLNTIYTDANAGGIQALNGFSGLPGNLVTPIGSFILNPSAYNLEIQSANRCQAAGASGPGTYPGR